MVSDFDRSEYLLKYRLAKRVGKAVVRKASLGDIASINKIDSYLMESDHWQPAVGQWVDLQRQLGELRRKLGPELVYDASFGDLKSLKTLEAKTKDLGLMTRQMITWIDRQKDLIKKAAEAAS